MNEKNKAAIYLRISREDGDMGESGSISNQRQLLMSFLSEREDLEFSGEYVDMSPPKMIQFNLSPPGGEGVEKISPP